MFCSPWSGQLHPRALDDLAGASTVQPSDKKGVTWPLQTGKGAHAPWQAVCCGAPVLARLTCKYLVSGHCSSDQSMAGELCLLTASVQCFLLFSYP